ncbi:CHAT domain-containing protein [Ilyonectria destructans]|nr:CHAT domain-containing protein [Ilyonectria destructans]
MTRQAVEAIPNDHPDRAEWLNALGTLLGDRFSQTDTIIDLNEAIIVTKQAIRATPYKHPQRPERLYCLAFLLKDRFSVTKVMIDLNEAIASTKQAVDATANDHPDRAEWLDTLGAFLGTRYSGQGEMADLQEAIKVSRQAIESTTNDHPERALRLNNLSVLLGDRFSRMQATVDIEEAVEVAREAVRITPINHPDLGAWLNTLSVRLGDQFSALGAIADLEEAVKVAKKVVKATPGDHPNRSSYLKNLSLQLGTRFSNTGAMADLEESVKDAREAIEITAEGHPDRAILLTNLVVQLSTQFSRTGVAADLEEVIQLARQVVNITPENHPERASQFSTLASVVCNRYQLVGAIADLEESIDASRRSVKATSDSDANRARRLNNLSAHLYYRFTRFSRSAEGLTNLDEAIDIARQAIEASLDGHTDRAGMLSSLSIQLTSRFETTRDMACLEEAISLAKEAVKITSDGHPDRAGWLYNLSLSLDHRFSSTRAMEDLEEATKAARQAVEATSDDYPGRAGLLNNLGRHLASRFSHTGLAADKTESRSCFQTALYSTVSLPTHRIVAGRQLLSAPEILQCGQEAYHIAKTTIDLVPLSAPNSLASVDKKVILSQVAGLASDAAAVALHSGQGASAAIELLESGRGLLASALRDLRTDLSSIQDKRPDLAQSFHDLRRILDAPTSADVLLTADVAASPSTRLGADKRHWASNEMAALLDKIRTVPGLERFLLPATETEMRLAAQQGPIVMVNVSSHRCDALLVETSGTRALALPELSEGEIYERAQSLQSLETLQWLWDVLVEPVLEALGLNGPLPVGFWPRVWWIPTGPLSKFPLHAAGYHLQSDGKTALDKVISSYSSSIKGIIDTRQARNKSEGAGSGGDVVLMAMNKTSGQSSLSYPGAEIHAVKSMCDLAGLSVIHPQPLQAETLSALEKCRVFHFAGHGSTKSDPLNSLLYLEDWQDHPLTVESLLEINLRSGAPFLAYLSACKTGESLDENLADESLHLTSAFQLAGFRHVIGTLWEVDDALCVDMARMTYKVLGESGFHDASISNALHQATRALRDKWLAEERTKIKSRGQRDAVLREDVTYQTPLWVPYVHYGV